VVDTAVFADDTRPPPFCVCPECGDFPQELYIDCRTEESLRACSSSCQGHLPVTYPPLGAIQTPTQRRIQGACTCGVVQEPRGRQTTDQSQKISEVRENPKLIQKERTRLLLRRWSAGMTTYGDGSDKKGEIVKGNEPLVVDKKKKVNEYQVRMTGSQFTPLAHLTITSLSSDVPLWQHALYDCLDGCRLRSWWAYRIISSCHYSRMRNSVPCQRTAPDHPC
jgi:hypothetical protein